MKRIVMIVLLALIVLFAAAAIVSMRSESMEPATLAHDPSQPKAEKAYVCARSAEAYAKTQDLCGKDYTAVYEGDGKGKCDRFVGCRHVMY